MAKRAVVVGAGPNGLAAACVLARAGLRVEVFEANETIGGGARTAELTLPGFLHDVGASAFPMGASSPVFRELELERFGLRWVQPGAAVGASAGGRDGGGAGAVSRGHRRGARR